MTVAPTPNHNKETKKKQKRHDNSVRVTIPYN